MMPNTIKLDGVTLDVDKVRAALVRHDNPSFGFGDWWIDFIGDSRSTIKLRGYYLSLHTTGLSARGNFSWTISTLKDLRDLLNEAFPVDHDAS
jgi:hypothetical protein